MSRSTIRLTITIVWNLALLGMVGQFAFAQTAESDASGSAFFERKIRPILVRACYECHSEQAQMREGGLLLDREAAWLEGGDAGRAVVPGDPEASLLIAAVKVQRDDLQMPPDGPLPPEEIALLEAWIRMGAPGPRQDMGETEFSQLGDQSVLLKKAGEHWAFQPMQAVKPPDVDSVRFAENPIDCFIAEKWKSRGLSPSPPADGATLAKRIHFSLTGLPPAVNVVREFESQYRREPQAAVVELVDRLMNESTFGQHFARMWLDVARYADTDSFYRPDTRTPHYFPFAFTYRDYVVDAFNDDKPYDQFITEQLAADLIGFGEGDREMAALGFLAVAPHANRSQEEALDDWIDVSTRGLMGMTVACARCHDHKYEPVPTTDYYALRGVFAALDRPSAIDRAKLPSVPGYHPSPADKHDFEQKLAAIERKISGAGNSKANTNNRLVAAKIRETELAELLLFHPGGPAHAMIVKEKKSRPDSFVFERGDPSSPGVPVNRRFLQVLDRDLNEFSGENSGRLDLARKIVSPDNPLTARVMVNRIWGYLMGDYLVATPSDFGLQGAVPVHPELLDWLALDFIDHGWSVKHLVRQIVLSQTFAQSSDHRDAMAVVDPENRYYWRANRKHFSIEMLRDRLLACSGRLDLTAGGRPGPLWDDDYTTRRAIYGYINRFNLDPTLRAFDFPTPMQTQANRDESIVASQALFTMNSPFVWDQAVSIVESAAFQACRTDPQRMEFLFGSILLRKPTTRELEDVRQFLNFQQKFANKQSRFLESPWPMVAQSLMMTNEFQYLD